MAEKVKLENFNELSVEIDYKSIIDEYAEKCSSDLKSSSPKGHRRSNTYAEGWTTKAVSKKKIYGVEVWNATNYQLTHLLENGHLIVNKRNGVGWASAQPHIENAYQKVKQPFIRAMENVKLDVDIK